MKAKFLFLIIWYLFVCCNDKENMTEDVTDEMPMEAVTRDSNKGNSLVVEKVSVTGNANSYKFSTTLSSPDLGCDQYADWWEVINEDGTTLFYRRILGHSHVNEQPFTRSGGIVDVGEEEIIIIRGHMNNSGYSQNALKGSVKDGFTSFSLAKDFGIGLSEEQPLPTNCAF